MTSIEPGLLSNGSEILSSRISTINIEHNQINCEYTFLVMSSWFCINLSFFKALPTDYVRLPFLNDFYVGFNRIEGTLPMFQNVARLLLFANSFTGSIPTEYGLLGNLTELHLEFNAGIIGTVPTELTECDKLIDFSIRHTGLSCNVTFCDSFGDNIVVRVTDVSICGEECECCSELVNRYLRPNENQMVMN